MNTYVNNLFLFSILVNLFYPKIVLGFTQADKSLMMRHGVGKQLVNLHSDSWGVKPSKIDRDSFVFKGQDKSIINWKMSPESWLDFDLWKLQRSQRDSYPEWKIKLREINHIEYVAKILKCFGACFIYRGQIRLNADYMTYIHEGDELVTDKDSYLWAVATDGSLIRVSPKTSISFNEVNIGVKDIYFFARLNYGHIHWQTRKSGQFQEQNLAETDLMFYPLRLKEVNREYFSILEYKNMNDTQRLLYQTRKNPGHVSQYAKLNKLMSDDQNLLSRRNTQVFLVTLNSSYLLKNAHFDVYHATNSDTKMRFYSEIAGFENQDQRLSTVIAYLRGYNNLTEKLLKENQWYLVPKDGRSIERADFSKKFNSISFFVKRIPTIHLAREIMIRQSFSHLLEKELTSKVMAIKHGYRLWDKNGLEFESRLSYLKEYTRRVETTNIISTSKIFNDVQVEDFDQSYYAKALSEQIIRLKELYSKKKFRVQQLNELQYYMWILKYGS